MEAQQEYARALDLYENAKTAAAKVERAGDLQPVTSTLDEGRWLLACVRARLAGEEPPERRLPCFFDPRHGPSVEDVQWAPPGGAMRDVPACAADATRIKDGLDPDVRLVPVGDGERRPYWDAGPAWGGWAGGYYGGFLPGILWGTLLGSSMSGWGAGGYSAGGDGGGGGFDGGGWRRRIRRRRLGWRRRLRRRRFRRRLRRRRRLVAVRSVGANGEQPRRRSRTTTGTP